MISIAIFALRKVFDKRPVKEIEYLLTGCMACSELLGALVGYLTGVAVSDMNNKN